MVRFILAVLAALAVPLLWAAQQHVATDMASYGLPTGIEFQVAAFLGTLLGVVQYEPRVWIVSLIVFLIVLLAARWVRWVRNGSMARRERARPHPVYGHGGRH